MQAGLGQILAGAALCLALGVLSAGCASSQSKGTQASDPANAFVHAAIVGDLPYVQKALDKGISPDTANAAGTTAAMAAASRGKINILELLYSRGAHLAITDSMGDNCWSFAITSHQPEVVQFLIDHNLDPNLPVYQDLSPLFIAVIQRQPVIVSELLKGGAKADFITDSGGPLHTSLRVGSPEIAKMLIDAGAPVNRQDPEGETPLMISSSMGDNEMVRLLLKRGAKKDLRDKSGKTAHDRALMLGHIDTAEILEK